MTRTTQPGHLARAMQRLRGSKPARHRALTDEHGLTPADYEEAAARAARVELARADVFLDGAFATGTVTDNGEPVTR